MSVVRFVLRHTYTVGAVLILVCLLGGGAALRMPIDIFPAIDIPVVHAMVHPCEHAAALGAPSDVDEALALRVHAMNDK